jgi:carbon monoxide dehydrogenase subunit G
MSDISFFESRDGKLSCSPREFFSFVSNMRNFERFVPEDKIQGWSAERETCSFNVSMVGAVKVAISDREEFTRVAFKGKALSDNNFTVNVNIGESIEHKAVVKVLLEAELNQMLKMVASRPIRQFLDLLVDEMEKFRDWDDTKG